MKRDPSTAWYARYTCGCESGRYVRKMDVPRRCLAHGGGLAFRGRGMIPEGGAITASQVEFDEAWQQLEMFDSVGARDEK